MTPAQVHARFWDRLRDERGAVAVIVALLIVVLGGSAAMVFDLARLRHERHLVQAAVDLGSLAGADLLPVSDATGAATAEATARAIAVQNASALAGGGLTINFACVVSGSGPGSPDLNFACGPAAGTGTWTGGWTTRGGKAIHDCNPYGGDLCNTIRLSASSTVDYYFAPLIGFNRGDTGAVRAAACRGFCGQASGPLDVVIVVDRTRSMSDADVADVKLAIANPAPPYAEDSVLEVYNPSDVHVGLVALPYKNQSNCPVGTASTQTYPAAVPPNSNGAVWQVVPLSDDYRLSDGTLNTSSMLVSRVQCLQRTGTITVRPTAGRGHTDYGDPLSAAQWMLTNDPKARPEAPNVIIFLGDGEANQPAGWNPCSYANNAATSAKATGTTIYSLAFGAGQPSGGGSGEDPRCTSDTSGLFANAYATTMFATVATDSIDNAPGDCDLRPAPDGENWDGDRYFCQDKGADLASVFRLVAQQTIKHSRLLNF